jgi:hypothetical protein
MNTAKPCLICKGSRALCGQQRCPLLPRFQIAPEIQRKVGIDFQGPSTNVFVGRVGYPNVGVGPLAAVEMQKDIDSPGKWFGMDYQKLVELRSLMIRTKQKESVFSRSRFVEENQELALASRPTDVEMSFFKKPVFRVSFSDVHQPMGPTATLQRMRVTENVKVSRKVEYIARDEIRAAEAGFRLYELNQDVYRISTILSSGILGLKDSQKMVPTRWSITATDDIIAKQLMERIRLSPSVNEYSVYEGSYLDNHFVILAMPGNWEYENFEAWAPGSMWTKELKDTQVVGEYEPFSGRRAYAEKEGGGYYAARIAACEHLASLGRQARVFSVREIYEGYTIPMGVWVVRETARNAFRNRPVRFSTLQEALAHMGTRLRLPMSRYLSISEMMRQKRIGDFFRTSGPSL